jgi:hypothetical protein
MEQARVEDEKMSHLIRRASSGVRHDKWASLDSPRIRGALGRNPAYETVSQ